MPLIKLNLGCGSIHLPGFVNVDRHGQPDVVHDLERFPWPWPDGAVGYVVAHHVLEHLGAAVAVYFEVIRELYRICAADARIDIRVPHPRHDSFLDDPTHVRVITGDGLAMFSQRLNRQWQQEGRPNSPLGLQLGVDFEMVQATHILEESWLRKLADKSADEMEVREAMERYNNVVKESRFVLRAVK